MLRWMTMGLLGLSTAAMAGDQRQFDVSEGSGTWDFDVRWKGDAGPEQVTFSVPCDAVDADREERTWFPRREFNEYVAKQVRAYGRSLKGRVELTAKVENGGVSIGVSGPRSKAKDVLDRAEKVRDEAVV